MDHLSQQDCYELFYYTLVLGDPEFIHHHVADAYTAQTATYPVNGIGICFALTRLYFHFEKDYTGREVQQMHILMSKNKRSWSKFYLPDQCGTITVSTILLYSPGTERNEKIHAWAMDVWDCFRVNKERIIALLNNFPALKF